MAQYQLYSSANEPASVARCPIDCRIPEFGSEAPQPPHNQNSAIPFTIDYSYFINDISSKRQPSQLREISNYNIVIMSVAYLHIDAYRSSFGLFSKHLFIDGHFNNAE